MDEVMFWRLVEASKAECTPELSNQPELLQHELEQLSPEEIRGFDSIFRQLYLRAYRRDLWAAAFIIEGGCSDDGFMDFRGGLIGLGREAYYAALANPESLAEQPARGVDFSQEDMLYVAARAYEAVTGGELPDSGQADPDLVGEDWDERTVYELYPKLTHIFRDS